MWRTSRECSWSYLWGIVVAGSAFVAVARADPPHSEVATPVDSPGTKVLNVPSSPFGPRQPAPIDRPIETPPPAAPGLRELTQPGPPAELLQTEVDPPLGFTGPSSVRPREVQENSHFVPVEDRWRIGFPDWDRYG